jgi:hypothetical protein
MYCPNCGKTVDKKLKYCNGCGERLGTAQDEKGGTPGAMLDQILETLFWFAMGGLGILIGLVAVLLSKDLPPNLVATIVIAYLATIFGVCFFLARQVPKLIDAKLKTYAEASVSTGPAQLEPVTTAQLDEYHEPVMSVTDHTTKTLDKVPLKRD